MKTSESIKELAAALAKAQGSFEHARKDADNPFFKSRYATLASVLDAAKNPLAECGLAVSQVIDYNEGGIFLETILMHSSGEWISGCYPIKPLKPDPQSLGSAITYSRRQSFSAITGIAADDDDGNSASQVSAPAVNGLKTFKQATDLKQSQPVLTTDYFAMLEDSKTDDELKKNFLAIPKEQKAAYVKVKDIKKKELADALISIDDVPNYPSPTEETA